MTVKGTQFFAAPAKRLPLGPADPASARDGRPPLIGGSFKGRPRVPLKGPLNSDTDVGIGIDIYMYRCGHRFRSGRFCKLGVLSRGDLGFFFKGA